MSKVEFDEYGDRLPLTPEDVSEFLETFGIDFKKQEVHHQWSHLFLNF